MCNAKSVKSGDLFKKVTKQTGYCVVCFQDLIFY